MDFENLHQILRSLYDEMMPLCEDMAGVAKGIAGLGALFYVAYRVWQSLARAEPIDVFPMLRPFAIGLCIMFFPTVLVHVQCLRLQHLGRALHNRREHSAERAQHHRGEEHDAQPYGKRTEHREHIYRFGMVFLALCAVVTVWSVWSSYRFAEKQREKIYVLDNGKSLMLALSQDLSQNRPAEAREHVRRFHELFFTLSPEKSAIEQT